MGKIKLISLDGLNTFLTNIKAWVLSLFEQTNKKVNAATWVGKAEDVEGAIERGEIIPGYTMVTITDDDDKEIIYRWATTQDIYDLFGLTYTG